MTPSPLFRRPAARRALALGLLALAASASAQPAPAGPLPSITAPAPQPLSPSPAWIPLTPAPAASTPAPAASTPGPSTATGAVLELEGQILMEAASGSAKAALDALPYVAHGRGKQLFFESGAGSGTLSRQSPGVWSTVSTNAETYRLTLSAPPRERQTGYALPVPQGCASRYEHDGRGAPVSLVSAWMSGGALGTQLLPLRLGRVGLPGSASLIYAWEETLISQVVACAASATRPAVVMGAWLELKPGWNLLVVGSEAGPQAQTVRVNSVPVQGALSMDLIPADH